MKAAISIICVLSAAVVAFLFWLIYFQEVPVGVDASQYAFLPGLNAIFNTLSACFVTLGLIAIKNKAAPKRRLHGICMALATAASALFLIGYIAHHSLNGDSVFGGQGWIRPVYFTILISHILLSIAVVPLLLTTLFAAAIRRFDVHRKVARVTYPIWLYVSVTGVLVFVFLRVV
ncbi:MAG: putative membrane protein [Lentimonas sp.]|jgi:putative membrane protein